MDIKLTQALNQRGVDASSLQLVLDTGEDEIFGFVLDGSKAVSQWQTLRSLVEQTGCWPAILGDDESLSMHKQTTEGFYEELPNWDGEAGNSYEESSSFLQYLDEHQAKVKLYKQYKSTADILNGALQIDPIGWLESQYEEMFGDDPDYSEEDIRGEWPTDAEPYSDFTIPFDLDGKPLQKVYLGLLPTKVSWHVPATLRYGGWNACPFPAEHTAVMKYWYELYGAEIVGITHDTIEMHVTRPPTDREQALKLAREQYAYCEDIVDQGVGTLDALAANLLDGKVWFFWWD